MRKENVREYILEAFKGSHWWELCPTSFSSLRNDGNLGAKK